MASPQSELLFASIQHSQPQRCVRLSHNPSVHVYYALKSKIENSSKAWLEEFLELEGLESLLDSLVHLSGKGFMNISDSVLQLDCIACVKAILNTKLGLLFAVSKDTCVLKLTLALDTPNILPRKQIFQLLTAIAVHDQQGYTLVNDALQHLAKVTGESHPYSIVVHELKQAESTPHKLALLAFINTLIGCGQDVKQRCQMRDQLTALGLLDVLHTLAKADRDGDLAVQVELFQHHKHRDEEALCRLQELDVRSARDVFNALSTKLIGQPETVDFLHILQDLYLLERKSHDRALLWQTLSKTIHHITGLTTKHETEDFLSRLKSLVPSDPATKAAQHKPCLVQKSTLTGSHNNVRWRSGDEILTCSPDFGAVDNTAGCSRRDSGISISSSHSYEAVTTNEVTCKRRGLQRTSFSKVSQLEKVQEDVVLASGPRKPVKPVKWVKAPARLATREVSLWHQMRLCPVNIALDWDFLEEEFAEGATIQDADDEVELLSGGSGLALNMLLARLETTPEELAGAVSEADEAILSPGALRYLVSQLPEEEEISQLRLYRGPRYDLGPAEQFLLYLSDIPDYRTLLEGMLFKADFNSKRERLQAALQAMITACRDVLHSPRLRDFVKVLIKAGNFLNANTPFGSASGVRLSSWCQLVTVRGKTHHTNLLETIIQCIEAQDEQTLCFVNDFPTLERATSCSTESLQLELTELNNKLKKLSHALALTHQSVRVIFELYIQNAKRDLQELRESVVRVQSLSSQVALYFCEDEATFNLKTCLQNLMNFCELVKRCQREGNAARKQKQVADKMREKLEEECINKQVACLLRNKASMCSSFVTPQTDGILDQLLAEVRRGNCQRFLGNELVTSESDDDHPLLVSHIDVDLEPTEICDTTFTLSLNEVCQGSHTKTYADRADAHIFPQYRKENQMKTASYLLALGDSNRPRLRAQGLPTCRAAAPAPALSSQLGSPGTVKVKVYPRLDPKAQPMAANGQRKKNHQRSNSELNRSTIVEERWKHYEKCIAAVAAEEDCEQVEHLEKPVPVITALGLETQCRVLDSQERDPMVTSAEGVEQRIINLDQNVEGFARDKKKRSSFGMLKRFVLGRRDSNIPDRKTQDRESKGRSQKGKKSGDANHDFVMENVGAQKRQKAGIKVGSRRLSLNKENAV